MSKIELEKNGRKIKVDARLAKVLMARGYFRRDMVAQVPPDLIAAATISAEPAKEIERDPIIEDLAQEPARRGRPKGSKNATGKDQS